MVCITEFRAREKLERSLHWIADSRVFPGLHRPHLGHMGAEMLQVGFILAIFSANLLYVLSMNDFRTGYALVVSAARSTLRVMWRPRGQAAG